MPWVPSDLIRLIFSDDFGGSADVPQRGKWIPFIGRDSLPNGVYGYNSSGMQKGVNPTANGLLVWCLGDGGGDGGGLYVGTACRAEFADLFSLTFKAVVPSEGRANGEKVYEFSLVDPNPPERFYKTHLSGKPVLRIYAQSDGAGNHNWRIENVDHDDFGLINGLPDGGEDSISVQLNDYEPNGVDAHIEIDNFYGSASTDIIMDRSRSGTWRPVFANYFPQSDTNYRSYVVRQFRVYGQTDYRSRHVVHVGYVDEVNGGDFWYDVSKELVSVKTEDRENSNPSLDLVLDTPEMNHDYGSEEDGYPANFGRIRDRPVKYVKEKTIDITYTADIRVGFRHMMWLIFRGLIDEYEWDYAQHTLQFLSTAGYGKMLDWRETHQENYNSDLITEILALTINHFDMNTELTADWIFYGYGLNLSTDKEAVSAVIQRLVQQNIYVMYIDMNRSLTVNDPYRLGAPYQVELHSEKNMSSFNLNVIDKILNVVTVKGLNDEYTYDASAGSRYGMREKSFTDESLTDLYSVQQRAMAIAKQYLDPWYTYTITTPLNTLISLYDLITWNFTPLLGEWNNDFMVKYVSHNYDPKNGLRTEVQGNATRYRISDALEDPLKKAKGLL